jgi:hypothetical protein
VHGSLARDRKHHCPARALNLQRGGPERQWRPALRRSRPLSSSWPPCFSFPPSAALRKWAFHHMHPAPARLLRLRLLGPCAGCRPRGARAAAVVRRSVVAAASSDDVGAAGTAAIAVGLLSNPIALWSEYTLATTGSGLPPGPGDRLPLRLEAAHCASTSEGRNAITLRPSASYQRTRR